MKRSISRAWTHVCDLAWFAWDGIAKLGTVLAFFVGVACAVLLVFTILFIAVIIARFFL